MFRFFFSKVRLIIMFDRFVEWWHGTKREQYVNISGMVTPWPDAMIVEFEPKP